MQADITRMRKGRGFAYYRRGTLLTDKAELQRITALAVPPAWTDVQINSDPNAKILATGKDKAGRTQAIYHPAFREHQEQEKFERLTRFVEKLPALRRRIDHDLHALPTFNKDTVIAAALLLIDTTYFRVGNARYAQEHHTYGVTTLRSRHINATSYSVTFDFTGKSGKEQTHTVTNRRLAHVIRQLDETPGQELFRYRSHDGTFQNINAADVNDYIKSHMGEAFTAKDFRTWGGTLTAIEHLADEAPAKSLVKRRKQISACVKRVAQRLGNTPAVARSSYIDPYVLAHYIKGEGFMDIMRAAMAKQPKPYFSATEQGALAVLSHLRKPEQQQFPSEEEYPNRRAKPAFLGAAT